MSKNENNFQPQPADEETDVVVEMPKEAIIKLVQENLVKSYEMLIWLFNISTPIATGLWTAFFTLSVGWKSSLFFSSIAFTVFSLALGFFIWQNRKKTFSSSVKKKIKISDIGRK